MQKIIRFLFILIVSFVTLSDPTAVFACSGKIPVFVSIAPQSYLVKQIGGQYVDVQTLIPPRQEPHVFAPNPRQVAMLIGQARKEGGKVVFVQPQFDPKSAETVAKAIGGSVVSMDPLAENILRNIEEMADKASAGLAQRKELTPLSKSKRRAK